MPLGRVKQERESRIESIRPPARRRPTRDDERRLQICRRSWLLLIPLLLKMTQRWNGTAREQQLELEAVTPEFRTFVMWKR